MSINRKTTRTIVNQVLGYSLDGRHPIHHVDGDESNNANDNLVVCEDKRYHHLLHKRAEAIRETGNPNWRRCGFCKKWDSPENLYIQKENTRHLECINKYRREERLFRNQVLSWYESSRSV